MPLSVTDLLGLPGLPTSKRGIQKWLKGQDLPLAIEGQRFTFALSDLPPEVRRLVLERDIAAAGLPLGTYDEEAHQDLAQATPKMRDVAERKAAIARSRQIIGGNFSEQLAPYLPDFPYDPTEARFIGKPVDFLVFSGI